MRKNISLHGKKEYKKSKEQIIKLESFLLCTMHLAYGIYYTTFICSIKGLSFGSNDYTKKQKTVW